MRSGGILRDRVRYDATMRYSGDESIVAFNMGALTCSKYLFTFTYDAVIDTGGVVLFTGNLITATLTIWFSPSVGMLRIRGDISTRVNLQSLDALQISHDSASRYHISPGVTYYTFDFGGGFGYEVFSLNARPGAQVGYSIIDGLSKNF